VGPKNSNIKDRMCELIQNIKNDDIFLNSGKRKRECRNALSFFIYEKE